MTPNTYNLSYNGLVNVIDLEALTKGKKEIAEIGITVLSLKERKVVKNYSVYVQPLKLNEDYDSFFYNLTGIKKATLAKAQTLDVALNVLSTSINLVKRPFVCWGEDNITLLQELRSKRITRYQPMHVVNLQLLYAFKTGQTENIGLQAALKECELEFEGKAHLGKVDSLNTAQLFLHLFK